MILQNGLVYDSEKCRFAKKDVYVKDGRFSDDGTSHEEYTDAEGYYVIPGLIDVHFHGCDGYDFCDGTHEAVDAITKYQAEQGITSVAPATMTLDDESLEKIFKNAAGYKGVYKKGHSEVIGINMEGPYISKNKKGAQNERFIHVPDAEHFNYMNSLSGGLIKLVALAPEVDGAMAFIDEVKDEVVVSIAHTESDYATADRAFEKGAGQVTHLFNAMNGFSHREPGVIGAAFDHKHVAVELICDGIHVMPPAIRAAFRLFGAERVILISDSMMAAGLSDGMYALGGQDVIVKGNKAVLSDGTIAGSVTNLMDCMKYAVSCGISFEEIIPCATKNPAKAIGSYQKYGSIDVGKYANFVILDRELNIHSVYIRGEKVDIS